MRLNRPDLSCATWFQGTIAVSCTRYRRFGPKTGLVSAPIIPAEPAPICIVDDDASVRYSIEQLLDSDGLKAQSFEDAEDFLAYAQTHPVPLAIVDVWMPKTSGLEVQGQLREVSPNTKVIVVTGQETPEIRSAALQGGASAFILKPFDDEVFLSLVRQALR